MRGALLELKASSCITCSACRRCWPTRVTLRPATYLGTTNNRHTGNLYIIQIPFKYKIFYTITLYTDHDYLHAADSPAVGDFPRGRFLPVSPGFPVGFQHAVQYRTRARPSMSEVRACEHQLGEMLLIVCTWRAPEVRASGWHACQICPRCICPPTPPYTGTSEII